MVPILLRRALGATLGLLLFVGPAIAQTGYGTLTGYVLDPEGSPLPGVTVTATSAVLLGERAAYTDATGAYRLINLPPGEYEIRAELQGFKPLVRGEVFMRAGASFRVDFQMELGGVDETITVTADTPMIDISKPGQVLTIDGDFQRAIPIQSRRNWSDFLELTPGIHARPFDDGSGRMVYFGHAAEHFSHVVQLEGQLAQGYRDYQPTYTQMSTDMVADVEIRSGGVEASSPIGTGLVINIVTKSGGNQFNGTLGYTLQPLRWNGDNDPDKTSPTTPTIQKVRQLDFGIGGPIVRDKVWFFSSGRWADNEAGISRTERELKLLTDYGAEPFNNIYEGFFPYVKVTSQIGAAHTLSGYYQYDRTDFTGDREYHVGQRPPRQTGGSLVGGKLTSIWGNNLTTDLLVTYNDKTSAYSSLENIESREAGPGWTLHGDTFISGGLIRGTGRLLASDKYGSVTIGPSSALIMRGDLTYYLPESRVGSHEIQTGFFAAPRYRRESTTHYLNGGFISEQRVLIDPDCMSCGSIPFYRDTRSPTVRETNRQRDRDIGIYLQDSWKATDRLNITAGVRIDFIRRFDEIFGVERMRDTAIGPRLGFSYMLTADAKNVLRGSVGRIHEQVGGRDQASSRSVPSTVSRLREWDNDLDGIFETTRFDPPATLEITKEEYDPDLHQPWVDEFILGYRRQFAGEVALDVGYIHRRVRDRYAYVEVNGFWPDGPGQPFGGYGRIDPNRRSISQLTNADFNTPIYHAIEITLAKRMSNNWQFMGSVNRQWQHMDGTWNPTDPARFIQPDHFEISRCIEQPRSADSNSLSGGTYCPTWREYSIRTGGTFNAPFGIVVTGSFSIQDGPWSGPILTRLDRNDPDIARFGPSTVVSSTGVAASNPLSTRTRFKHGSRDEGQVKLPDAKYLNLRIGRRFDFWGPGRSLEVSLNILNLMNWGNFQQYTYNGANEEWNPSFLEGRSMQAARAFQIFTNFTY